MTSKLTRDIIQSEIADFFAGVVEIHTELGGPNTVEEAQNQLTDRVLACVPEVDSEPVARMHSNNNIGIPAITVSQKIGHYWMAEFENVQPLYRHAQPAPVMPEGLRLALSNAGIAAPESDEVLAATQSKYVQALVSWVKDRKPFNPAPVAYSDFEEFWSAYIHPLAQDDELKDFAWDIWCAAMLQTQSVCTCPSGDGSLRWPCPSHPGNSPVIPDCWCRTCRPVTMGDMRFVLCPDCGNKRCPRANDHRNACSGSNEPGQEGSAYPAAPREVQGE